jgi:hypothetical protein
MASWRRSSRVGASTSRGVQGLHRDTVSLVQQAFLKPTHFRAPGGLLVWVGFPREMSAVTGWKCTRDGKKTRHHIDCSRHHCDDTPP